MRFDIVTPRLFERDMIIVDEPVRPFGVKLVIDMKIAMVDKATRKSMRRKN